MSFPPPPLEVVESIHTNQFLSVPDHNLNETQRERERGREGEREKGREGERERGRERFVNQHYRGRKTQFWTAFHMKKMISQQPLIRATPEEPQAPPLAEGQILPRQLEKPTVARPSKA